MGNVRKSPLLLLLPASLLADPLLKGDWGEIKPVASSSPQSVPKRVLKGAWGEIKGDFRYRYEYVDEAGLEEAHASTLRIRLGYLTPPFRGLQGYAEMEGNYELGIARYNSLRKKRDRSVVADPQETELNQAWLQWEPPAPFWSRLRVGRQRIIHDDSRFIGNVVWRQLEQTYDAVRLQLEPLPKWRVEFAFLWRVQNVLSRTIDMTSPLLHMSYAAPFGKLTAYAYWLDYDDPSDSQNFLLSSQTYGLRLEGERPLWGELKGLYHLEYARQMDYAKNPIDYSTDYYRLLAGFRLSGVTVKGGVENLTADSGIGFATPLATLHAFQGWADRFLKTPPNGVRDLLVLVQVPLFGAKLTGVYHDFQDENGRERYGEEFDLLLSRRFGESLTLLLKYAHYDSEGFSRSVDKVWGQLELHF